MRVFAEKSQTAYAASSLAVTPEKTPPPPSRAPQGRPNAGFDFSRIPIHAKLAINPPGDQYEQEADRVADHVVRVPEPGPEHRGLQLKPVSGETPGPTETPPIVHEILRTPGERLDAATRAFMEPRFGHDFGRVRVHTDAAGARSAEALHARAYTSGTHIVFANGFQDRTLLAHELTHVVQQRGGERAIQRSPDPDTDPTSANPPGGLVLNSSGLDFHKTSPADLLEAALTGSVTIDDFDTGKSDISEINGETLTAAANTILTLLRKYPASTVRSIGHADSVGTEEANQALGQERADSVQAFLVKAKIPVEAIRTESRGQKDPAVNTRNPEPKNRRVEVRFEPSSLLSGSLPGAISDNKSHDQPTDDAPKGPSVVEHPDSELFDKRFPDLPPQRLKPDRLGDLKKAYKAGEPDEPPVTSDQKPPELGGPSGTHILNGPDIPGLRRVLDKLRDKPKTPTGHHTNLPSEAEPVVQSIKEDALLPAALKGTKVDPDQWIDNAEGFALSLYREISEAQKSNQSEVNVSLPEGYRKLNETDRAAIQSAIEVITAIVREVVEDHASKVTRVTIHVGQSKEIWGVVNAQQ
jgi:outer membrane protein OmpA-like peptidoglycan-associated protein